MKNGLIINERSYQNRINNAQGHLIEGEVMRGCMYYKEQGFADIDKTPEPFRVIKKGTRGIFTGQFTKSKAQPDFKGTMRGGKTIVFEVKSTQEDNIKQSVLSEKQSATLESYYNLGAISFVLVAIQDEFFTVPWDLWRDMKEYFGRKYVKAIDLERYHVKYSLRVCFLDKVFLIKVKE